MAKEKEKNVVGTLEDKSVADLLEMGLDKRRQYFGEEIISYERMLETAKGDVSKLPKKVTILVPAAAKMRIKGVPIANRMLVTPDEENYITWMLSNRRAHDKAMKAGKMGNVDEFASTQE